MDDDPSSTSVQSPVLTWSNWSRFGHRDQNSRGVIVRKKKIESKLNKVKNIEKKYKKYKKNING